jgi:hypothetical protein
MEKTPDVKVSSGVQSRTEEGLLLTPVRVTAMLEERSKYQLIKFRTTCTDCVPNM